MKVSCEASKSRPHSSLASRQAAVFSSSPSSIWPFIKSHFVFWFGARPIKTLPFTSVMSTATLLSVSSILLPFILSNRLFYFREVEIDSFDSCIAVIQQGHIFLRQSDVVLTVWHID